MPDAQLVNDSEPTKLDGLDGGEINATVALSEPKQSILLLDKNGLLLTANRRSRNDPRRRLRIVIPAKAGIQ